MVMTILKEIGKALLGALLTEAFVKSLVIWGLEKLAKRTDNKIDDELVAKIKEALEKDDKKDEEPK